MSNYPNILRLNIIKYFISRTYKTKREILTYLKEKDVLVSARTLERDLKQLKDNLGFDLIYKKNRGYYIDLSNNYEAELLQRYDEVVKINQLLNTNPEAVQYVLDTTPVMIGVDLLPDLFLALKEKKMLNFRYLKFNKNNDNDDLNSENNFRSVIPLWLKEHIGRWYLIALPLNGNEIRTFGLDRIHDLTIADPYNSILIAENIAKQVDAYKFMLGISKPTFDDLIPYRIELAISDTFIEYCISKPIHLTQKITNRKIDNYTVVEFVLIPNIDLFKLIVSELGDIKLIGPDKIKKYMQKEYKSLMKQILD